MKLIKSILLSTVLATALTACSDEETYTADVMAVNLIEDEIDVIWQYEDEREEWSLTDDKGLLFGEASSEKLLVQDETDRDVFGFYAIDGNTKEVEIDQTYYRFDEHADYLVYTYGLLGNDGRDQKARIGAVKVIDEGLNEDKYSIIVFHTYVSDMGDVDIFIGEKKIGEAIEYGEATKFWDLSPDENVITVKKADRPKTIAQFTISPEAGDAHVAFVVNTPANDENILAYKVNIEK